MQTSCHFFNPQRSRWANLLL